MSAADNVAELRRCLNRIIGNAELAVIYTEPLEDEADADELFSRIVSYAHDIQDFCDDFDATYEEGEEELL